MTPAAQLPDTPSARIVAEIDRRISSGELQIGDRVPSTRQIIAEFGVAMATATKALTTLRQQGRVHTVPGVGTMVGLAPTARADRQRPEGEPAAVATAIRTGAREQPLSRERVVRAAVVIAADCVSIHSSLVIPLSCSAIASGSRLTAVPRT